MCYKIILCFLFIPSMLMADLSSNVTQNEPLKLESVSLIRHKARAFWECLKGAKGYSQKKIWAARLTILSIPTVMGLYGYHVDTKLFNAFAREIAGAKDKKQLEAISERVDNTSLGFGYPAQLRGMLFRKLLRLLNA